MKTLYYFVKQYKNFISINGTDLNMNISDHSVDYVLVSQSYHRFNSYFFKKECERVLKDKNNVIIIWYRVDFNNPIYAEMLASIKKITQIMKLDMKMMK